MRSGLIPPSPMRRFRRLSGRGLTRAEEEQATLEEARERYDRISGQRRFRVALTRLKVELARAMGVDWVTKKLCLKHN